MSSRIHNPENLAVRLSNLRIVTDDKEALLNLDAAELAVLYAEASDIVFDSFEALTALEKTDSF